MGRVSSMKYHGSTILHLSIMFALIASAPLKILLLLIFNFFNLFSYVYEKGYFNYRH